MNFNLLFIFVLLVFNSSRSEEAVDETVIKKLDLQSDALDQLTLDKTSPDKLNVSDPSLKNISDKLSSKDDEITLKNVKERETDKEVSLNAKSSKLDLSQLIRYMLFICFVL